MSSKPLNPSQDEWITDALRTLPLADPPPQLASGVISRIQMITPVPRFALTWLDLALGIFASVMAGLLALLPRLLPPYFGLYLRLWLLKGMISWIDQPSFVFILAGVGAAVVAGLFSAGVVWALIELRTYRRRALVE